MIRVYEPIITESDAQAATEAIRSGILSSFGPEVLKFENNFKAYIGNKYALSCSSGTAALHLALAPFVEAGSVVAFPTCSYAATAFAALHHNCIALPIDCERDSWNMDLDCLESWCQHNTISAVIAVHNYGNPMDMLRLMKLSQKYGFIVIEDACEALTGEFDNQKLGSFGHVGVFSFYGSKLITSGEGGAVVTNDPKAYERMKLERGQGQDPNRRFWHVLPGWNYRLTNIQAAILNSQFSRLDEIIAKKNEIYERYRDMIDADLVWQQIPDKGKHSWWMISVRHWELGWHQRAQAYLNTKGIETRPIFPPIHQMPFWGPSGPPLKGDYPNSEYLTDTGISLPSGLALTHEQIDYICKSVNETV